MNEYYHESLVSASHRREILSESSFLLTLTPVYLSNPEINSG